MLRCKMSVALVVVCAAALILPAVAQATFLQVSADTAIMPRSDLIGANSGGSILVGVGGEDTWAKQDRTHALFRWDLSGISGPAASDVTIAFRHTQDDPIRMAPRNFDGESLDLYLMPLGNSNWEEGAGSASDETGAAWNRRKGEYSTTPADADKWLPTATNDAHEGISLVNSITWNGAAMGTTASFTVSAATFNSWVADGVASLMLKSDSVDAKLESGDTTQRLWMVAAREQADGTLAATITGDFSVVPEPGSIVLIVTGMLGLLAYAWRKRK